MTSPTLSWTFQADRLTLFADYVMDTVVSVFNSAGVDLPPRQLVTVGEPVHDCEELVMTFKGMTNGVPGAAEEPSNCNSPITATFEVHLVRCFPTPVGRGMTPPTAEVLTVNAIGLMNDAWLLMQAANAMNSDTLYSTFGFISSVTTGEPSGGFVGIVLSVDAAVP
jgi:hypothetical protein